jgi:hypothetical protein
MSLRIVVLQGPLTEIGLGRYSVRLNFREVHLVVSAPFSIRGEHLGQQLDFDPEKDPFLVSTFAGALWHLAEADEGRVQASSNLFELTFPCGCVLFVKATGYPEDVMTHRNDDPLYFERWPADHP